MQILTLVILLLSTAQPSDDALQQKVQKELEEAGFDTGKLRVAARNGAVTLSGQVRDAREKLRVIQTVFRVAEVESVDADLRLLLSKTPAVEEEIWSLLMQHGLDRGIAAVLVEDRTATLRGEVPNDETRTRIVTITQSVIGVASVVNEIEIASGAADARSRDAVSETSETSDPATVTHPEAPLTQQQSLDDAGRADEPAVESRSSAPGEKPETSSLETREEAPPLEPSARPLTSPDVTGAVDSTQVASEIIHQIVTYPGYTVFDNIQFGLNLGVVTLSGVVTEVAKKDELEHRIASLLGVAEVHNKIRVLPNSSADQKLREQLFERIYANSLFAEYADQRNPPVHILVEAKGVILTGVVDEVLKRMVAEGLALNTFGVRSVQNRIRVRKR